MAGLDSKSHDVGRYRLLAMDWDAGSGVICFWTQVGLGVTARAAVNSSMHEVVASGMDDHQVEVLDGFLPLNVQYDAQQRRGR